MPVLPEHGSLGRGNNTESRQFAAGGFRILTPVAIRRFHRQHYLSRFVLACPSAGSMPGSERHRNPSALPIAVSLTNDALLTPRRLAAQEISACSSADSHSLTDAVRAVIPRFERRRFRPFPVIG